MNSKLPINRNTDEWDLPKEIADEIVAAVDAIERGEVGRTTQIVTRADGRVERIVTEPDGTEQRELFNEATAARLQIGLSQSSFAKLTGISLRTLQEWEQGRRQPSGAARALLKIAVVRPDVLREVLAEQ